MRILLCLALSLFFVPFSASSQTRNPDGDLRDDNELLQDNQPTNQPDNQPATIRIKETEAKEPAQELPLNADSPSFWSLDRLVVGGGLGASFGSVVYIELSPTALYFVTDMFRVCGGMTYRYVNDTRPFLEYKANVIGGRAIAQHEIFGGLFAHAEYEYLKARYFEGDNLNAEINFPSFLVGGGYAMPIGGGTKYGRESRSMIQLQVLYPISLNSGYSLYYYPVEIRMAVLIGL